MRKIFVVLVLISCISFFVQGGFLKDADAKTFSEHEPVGKTGLVAASVVSSAVYLPFKAAYAVLGGITGGLTYAVSMAKESEAANKIALNAFTGDWYIHPNILTKEEELNFIGPDDKSP